MIVFLCQGFGDAGDYATGSLGRPGTRRVAAVREMPLRSR
jgi:hypothetical protein